ncbi:MAG: PIN domain-containing protein [Saprospiraceae bacterium]
MSFVVPDSNILYACLRTANSKARRILLTRNDLTFFTPNFLIAELFTHAQRLRAKSGISDEEFEDMFRTLVYTMRCFGHVTGCFAQDF